MTRSSVGERPGTALAAPSGGLDRSATVAFWGAVAVIAATVAIRLRPLPVTALTLDLGLHYHLSVETARGAVPLIDFEHGWNALGWYVGAGVARLVGDNPALWVWVFGPVTGMLLAGVATLVAARRLHVGALALLALTGAWLLLVDVPNGKYAIPSLWVLVALPTGRLARGRAAIAARAVLAGVTVLLHVDLAIMLTAGLAAFDLVGRRGLRLRERLSLAAAPVVGAALAFAGEMTVHAWLGLAPADLIDLLVLDHASAPDGSTFGGYPLFDPQAVAQLAYPASLLLPFVPPVWRRLSDPTRLTALLHVSMALTALRKTDASHTLAAATLLALLVVLIARDLHAAGPWRLGATLGPRRVAHGLLGACGFAVAAAVTFVVPSVLAYVGLGACVLAAIGLSATAARPWTGVGAAAAAAVLAIVSLGVNGVATAEDPGGTQAQQIAAAVAGPIEDCLGPERSAWVVPHPLGVYRELALTNPTPFFVFWSGFEREMPRVREMVAAGRIPVVIQINNVPGALRDSLGEVLEDEYRVCLRQRTGARRDLVTVWRWRGQGARS